MSEKSIMYEKAVIEGASNVWSPIGDDWRNGHEDATLVHLYMRNRPRTRYTLTFHGRDALAPKLRTDDTAIGVEAEVFRERVIYNSEPRLAVIRLHHHGDIYTPSEPSLPSWPLVLSSDE